MNKILKKATALTSALMILISGAVSASADMPVSSTGVYANSSIAKPQKIKMNVSKKTIYIGQKYNLSPKNTAKVTWKSSDPTVAAVSSKGVVKGKSSGTAIITAVLKSDKTVAAKYKISVKDYGKKSIKFTSAAVIYEVPGEGNAEYKTYADLDKITSIKSVMERNKLIKYIRRNYPDTDPFSKRSQVIKQLKTYNGDFFEDNVLIFSLSVTEGVNSKYVNGGTRSVIKKFSGGKLTVYVKTAYSESIPHNEESDDELHTRFTAILQQ